MDSMEDYDEDYGDLVDFLLPSDNDYILNEADLPELQAPPTERWADYKHEENPVHITMDSAKDRQWILAKEEIRHVKKRVMDILLKDDIEQVTDKDLAFLCLGPESGLGSFFKEYLQFDKEMHLKFMIVFCTQTAYRLTSTQLFHKLSLLKEHAPLSEHEYNDIWRRISEERRISCTDISTNSRRETPLWEYLEAIVNELLRSVSIAGRHGVISLSLDDDKIWASFSKILKMDRRNLKYTTHVKANRKGIIAHTAVSTGVMLPLGISFERAKDSTLSCFCRILDYLFGQNGTTNLRNVHVHSDRGYTIPSVVFDCIGKGAEVVGTVKRMAQCWPFTYNQKLKPNDKRTVVDVKGAPTLFLKWCKAGVKYLFASAFRNGSESVATAISTLHTKHQWEGIVMKPSELVQYKNDKNSLTKYFFERISAIDQKYKRIESESERNALNKIIRDKIDPMTLRQGMYK